MMRQISCLPIATLALLAACVDLPSESTTSAEVVTANRITANRITANRITANRITANRITANRITANRLTPNPSVNSLLATPDGREVFSLIVSCALPDSVTLVATVSGTEFEFPGEIGVAPQWLQHALDGDGQRWVSACMFARLNARAVAVPISIRGPNRALDISREERADFAVEEGAFFGNFFGPLDEPLQAYACRGEGQAAGETGGLIDRDCTEPDPANPGFTQCGFIFAGDCGTFSARPVCEEFSEHGTFYRRCHTAPIRHGRGCDRDEVFREVVTTFVLP
jgi:hypothetical protein